VTNVDQDMLELRLVSGERYLILGTGGASIDHEAALFRGGLAPHDAEWVNVGLGSEWIRRDAVVGVRIVRAGEDPPGGA
jgi:hypothetical protein